MRLGLSRSMGNTSSRKVDAVVQTSRNCTNTLNNGEMTPGCVLFSSVRCCGQEKGKEGAFIQLFFLALFPFRHIHVFRLDFSQLSDWHRIVLSLLYFFPWEITFCSPSVLLFLVFLNWKSLISSSLWQNHNLLKFPLLFNTKHTVCSSRKCTSPPFPRDKRVFAKISSVTLDVNFRCWEMLWGFILNQRMK